MMTIEQRLKYLETDLMDMFCPGKDGVLGVGRKNPFVPNRKPQGIQLTLDDGTILTINLTVEEVNTTFLGGLA